MAKQKGSGSAVTAPKGRPTAGRGESPGRGRRITPTMEWILALIVIAVVIVALVVVFGDVRGSPTHSGSGATAPADIVALAAIAGMT